MKVLKLVLALVATLVAAEVASAFNDDPYALGYDPSRITKSFDPTRQAWDNDRIMEQNRSRLDEWSRDAQRTEQNRLRQQEEYNRAAFGHTFYKDGKSVTCYPTYGNTSTCF